MKKIKPRESDSQSEWLLPLALASPKEVFTEEVPWPCYRRGGAAGTVLGGRSRGDQLVHFKGPTKKKNSTRYKAVARYDTPEEKANRKKKPSALREHSPCPCGVTYQSFRKKVTENVTQAFCDLRIVAVPGIECHRVLRWRVQHRKGLEHRARDSRLAAESLRPARVQYALPHGLLADANESSERAQSCAGATLWGEESQEKRFHYARGERRVRGRVLSEYAGEGGGGGCAQMGRVHGWERRV